MDCNKKMKHIGVFLGASNVPNKDYENAIRLLAKEITKRNYTLVYGGAGIGLMGLLADLVLRNGGDVIGVIPECLIKKEIAHDQFSKLHIVNLMHERKELLANISDVVIVFPGGLATLEEAFEAWNAVKIGLYKKPIDFLNANGYFDSLFAFLEQIKKEGFVSDEQLQLVQKSRSPAELLEILRLKFQDE